MKTGISFLRFGFSVYKTLSSLFSSLNPKLYPKTTKPSSVLSLSSFPMASSKLVHLSSVFTRSYRRTSLCSSSHLLFPVSTFSPIAKSQPLLRFCTAVDSSPAVVSDAAPLEATLAVHPWPEWDSFLEKLKSKGYLEKSTDEQGEDNFVNQNKVKNACLKFARERYDILSSLNKEDMKAMVESRCPNLFRKFINSSKRLRAFMHIVEADACGVCKLRNLCDKAYLESQGGESARTVDIIRIILGYAFEPKNLSGENNNNNNNNNYIVKENIQKSARNLLTELIKLSDTMIDPNIPKPVARKREKEGRVKQRERKGSVTAVEIKMQKGDWICPKCEVVNFARNMKCCKCNELGPEKVENNIEMKPGDWICPKCEFLNFSKNRECFRCEEPYQRPLNFGEWECPDCNYVNFKRNVACRICNFERPEGTGGVQFEKPRQNNFNQNNLNLGGEWECPDCNYVNFKRNTMCRKCNIARPEQTGGDQLQGRLWQKPKQDFNNNNNNEFEDLNGEEEDDKDKSRFETYRKLSQRKPSYASD